MVFASHEDYLRFIRSTPVEPERYVEPLAAKREEIPEEQPEAPAEEKPKRRKKA